MRTAEKELLDLLKAKINIIWINTYEEEEAIKSLKQIIIENTSFITTKINVWSASEGLKSIPIRSGEQEKQYEMKYKDPTVLSQLIMKQQKEVQTRADGSVMLDNKGKPIPTKNSAFFVLRDYHLILNNPLSIRCIRDVKEYKGVNYNPIIIISPLVNVPLELEKLVYVVDYDTLNLEDIEDIVTSFHNRMKMNKERTNSDVELSTPEEIKNISKLLAGMTIKEISDILTISLKKYNKISEEIIMEHKMQLIKKSGVLEYNIPNKNFDDIGGNENFKQWVEEVEFARSEEALAFGCEPPKGYLALGLPGTAKSFMAEALAGKLHVPFIELKLSGIMDKLVGNSEKKIEQALKIVKACSPCVLLIDEVEKQLGGISSSNSSDSGTVARVFASILTFLQNNKDVFVVMTSNDVSQLPPELTRSGRLDAMFYFSAPTEEERKEIFKIHLAKTGKEYDENILKSAVKASEGYTGAEIQNAVKATMWKAFKRYKQDGVNAILEEDLIASIKEVIPISRSSKEKIAYLENWVKGRARYASNVFDNNGYDSRQDLDLLNDLEDDEYDLDL